MSFILDAIKKSESERQKNRQPDIHSLQNAAGYLPEKNRTIRRSVSFVFSIILILAFGIWLWPQLEQLFIDRQPEASALEKATPLGLSLIHI